MDGGWGWDELCECCTGTGTGTGTDFGTGTDPIAVNTPCSGLMSAPYFLQSAVNAGGTSTDSNDDLLFVVPLGGPATPNLFQNPTVGRPATGWQLDFDGTGGGKSFAFVGFETPIRSLSECRPLYQAYLCGEFLLTAAGQNCIVYGALMQDGVVYCSVAPGGGSPFGVAITSSTSWKGTYQGFTETSIRKVTAYNQSSPYMTTTPVYPNFNIDGPDIFIGYIIQSWSTSQDQEIHLDNWVARRDLACCGGTSIRPFEYAVDFSGVFFETGTSADPCILAVVSFLETFLAGTTLFYPVRLESDHPRYFCFDEISARDVYLPECRIDFYGVTLRIEDCTFYSNPTITVTIQAATSLSGGGGYTPHCSFFAEFTLSPTCAGNPESSCCTISTTPTDIPFTSSTADCPSFDIDPSSIVTVSL